MKDQEKLRLVLQFLSLGNKEKVSSLPAIPHDRALVIYETNIKTDNPLFCVGYECYACIDANKFGADATSHILAEMECLMDSMITHERHIWMWNTGVPGLSDSPHLFWAILRRLAKEALKFQNWPEAVPDLSGENFFTVGEWLPK